MKNLLLLFCVLYELVYAQSNWQVYKIPYDESQNVFTFSDNTGTPPFLKWMKNTVGINYTSSPSMFYNGFVSSINSWANSRFTISSGTDVTVSFVYGNSFFGYAPVTVNNQTGEIISGQIQINLGYMGSYPIVWNENGISRIDFNTSTIQCDVTSTLTHEMGHIWGLFHHKTGGGKETMSTWDQLLGLGYSPAERRNIKTDDWSAFYFLYPPPLTNAYIDGPNYMYNEGNYFYNVSTVNGYLPFTYTWQMRKISTLTSKAILAAAPGEDWYNLQANGSTLILNPPNNGDWRDFELRCIVTDIRPGVSITSNTIYVDVENIPYPQGRVVSNNLDQISLPTLDSEKVITEKVGNTMLGECYPNPFNPTTIINYRLEEACMVSLKIYNTIGEEIAVLVNEQKPAGNHNVQFNAINIPSGIYFYKLNTNRNTFVKKMLLTK